MRIARIAVVFFCLAVFDRDGTAFPTAAPVIGSLRIVLLVDSSGAVGPLVSHFRAGMNAFLDVLPEDQEIAIISTGGQLRVRVPPTTDRERLRKAAQGFSSDGGGNAFLDTLLEADKRFLKTMPDRRPVFVVVTTDNGATSTDVRIDEYNRFMRDFQQRGGRAHGIVMHGRLSSGATTDIVMNMTGNTGGFYDSLVVANSLPDRMKVLAENVAADIF